MLAVRRVLPSFSAWLESRPRILRAEASSLGILVGAMVGALSHPVLDGLMHPDIEPLQPWSAANPLHDLVGLEALHLGCLVAGGVGAILLLNLRARER